MRVELWGNISADYFTLGFTFCCEFISPPLRELFSFKPQFHALHFGSLVSIHGSGHSILWSRWTDKMNRCGFCSCGPKCIVRVCWKHLMELRKGISSTTNFGRQLTRSRKRLEILSPSGPCPPLLSSMKLFRAVAVSSLVPAVAAILKHGGGHHKQGMLSNWRKSPIETGCLGWLLRHLISSSRPSVRQLRQSWKPQFSSARCLGTKQRTVGGPEGNTIKPSSASGGASCTPSTLCTVEVGAIDHV